MKISRGFILPIALISVLILFIAIVAACNLIEESEAPSAQPTAAPAEESAEETEPPAPAADPSTRNDMYDAPPPVTIDASKFYYATFKTAKGDIRAQLFADRAPVTVNNFVFLAREGFYDNTSFHRVLADFMAQAGDPTGTGSGGPGYSFQDEFDASLQFDRPGLLAMANSGPATNGSQFFITFAETPWLNNRHTIFGEVVDGFDVLAQLTLRDPSTNPDFEGDELSTVTIEESEQSELPPPPPTPTPFAPTAQADGARPLADIPAEERAGYFNAAPEMVLDTSKLYTATITTPAGDLTMVLDAESAPIAVNNFVTLANLGFYDGLPVNLAQPGQFIIVGSPNNLPTGDAGYGFDAEVNTAVPPLAGAVAYNQMQGRSGFSSSQIVIILSDLPAEASQELSFFAQIVESDDVLAQLATGDVIESITIAVGDK